MTKPHKQAKMKLDNKSYLLAYLTTISLEDNRMTNNNICITTSLQTIQNLVDLSAIPNISNSYYTIKLEDLGKGLFAFKRAVDKNLLEYLNNPTEHGISETDAAYARAWYMNLQKNGEVPANLLSCFTDKSFTGLILCGLPVTVHKPEHFGFPMIVNKSTYTTLLMQVTDIVFTSDKIDVSNAKLYGWINGETKDSYYEDSEKTFHFQINQTQSLVNELDTLYSSITCEFQLNQLFSSSTTMISAIQLIGIYQHLSGATSSNSNYSFPDTETFAINLISGYINTIIIEHIITEMRTIGSDISLTMHCSGLLKFSLQSGDYDLFSYGDEKDEISSQGGLLFQNLQLRLTLKQNQANSSMIPDYRNISFTEKGSTARKNSFASQFKHECPGFVSYQNGITPEQMKYTRILTPFPQKRLGSTWYALTMKIKIFGNLEMELLFAFDDSKLFVGNRMGNNGSSTFYNISTNSPFKIQMKSMMLQVKEANDHKQYGLLFKGVQASLFGLTIPEGNCNLFMSEDSKGESAWYAVYGNRVKGEDNGNN